MSHSTHSSLTTSVVHVGAREKHILRLTALLLHRPTPLPTNKAAFLYLFEQASDQHEMTPTLLTLEENSAADPAEYWGSAENSDQLFHTENK
jgi:hypothetical protein